MCRHGQQLKTMKRLDEARMWTLLTKFQSLEPSSSEEEVFFSIFYIFLWFKPRTPLGRGGGGGGGGMVVGWCDGAG